MAAATAMFLVANSVANRRNGQIEKGLHVGRSGGAPLIGNIREGLLRTQRIELLATDGG
jgi:hypothetical protein